MSYACKLMHGKTGKYFAMRQNGTWSEAPLNPESKWPEEFVAVARVAMAL